MFEKKCSLEYYLYFYTYFVYTSKKSLPDLHRVKKKIIKNILNIKTK